MSYFGSRAIPFSSPGDGFRQICTTSRFLSHREPRVHGLGTGVRHDVQIRPTILGSGTNLEFFYWVSIALMFLIHAGFLAYETGASRVKNVLASAMKNLMMLAIVIPVFFFVGWFLYNSMPTRRAAPG
jgi:Ammonium Transporter Family